MHLQRFGDALPHAQQRVEGAGRVLRHDADPASEPPQLGTAGGAQIRARHLDPTVARSQQSEGGPSEGGLPRSGLPDDTQHLTGHHLDGDLVQGPEGRPAEPTGVVDVHGPERQGGRDRGFGGHRRRLDR